MHPLTPGRMLYLLRYNHERGWRTAYYDYVVLPRIFHWQPADSSIRDDIEVHILTCSEDWVRAAWTIASFCHFTGCRWPFVIHEDGSLDDSDVRTLEQWLPDLRVIRRAEADEVVSREAAPYQACCELRAGYAPMLKLVDTRLFAATERLVLLDSDVLFFRRPDEILEWADTASDACWFNPDFQHSSNIQPDQAKEKWGIDLWMLLNSGLGLLPREVIDLAFCEEVLREGTIREQGSKWVFEQTLMQLCASRHGKGGLLPAKYEVSFSDKAADGIVARHYVGHVRQQFFSEGVARLAPVLLP